jgi:hypothetical protein
LTHLLDTGGWAPENPGVSCDDITDGRRQHHQPGST